MKNINAITNIFGAVAGIPQIVLGATLIGSGNYPEGIAKIAEGVGLFVVAFFVGKNVQS
jgi:hypothetical protein